MHTNGKASLQCMKVAKNKQTNRVLGMIRRTVASRCKDVILRLYKPLVRLHLEYCIQVWNPHLKKDVGVLERVQRRATRMRKGLGTLSYGERLKRWQKRSRGDLIEVFQILLEKEGLLPQQIFEATKSKLLLEGTFVSFTGI